MNEYIHSFLQKINPQYEHKPLSSNGPKVSNNYKYLSSFLPTLPSHKVQLLSILLQHQNIKVFTREELKAVAQLRLELLSDYSNEKVPTVITNMNPLFDTGSSLVYRRLYDLGVPSLQLNYMTARKIKSIKGFIQEIM